MHHIQLEEGVGNLQHENMWVIMLVADQNSFARPSHAILMVVLFQSLQSCRDGRVLFWLVFFGAKGVIAEWEQADGFRLVGVECFWEDGTARVRSHLEELTEIVGLTDMRSVRRSLSL